MIRCDPGGSGGSGPEGRAAPPPAEQRRFRSAITLSFDLITSIISVVFVYDERPVCTLDYQVQPHQQHYILLYII